MIFARGLSVSVDESTWFVRYSNVSIPNVRRTETRRWLSRHRCSLLYRSFPPNELSTSAHPCIAKLTTLTILHPRYLAPSCRFSSMTFDPVPWNLTNSSPRSKVNYPADVSREERFKAPARDVLFPRRTTCDCRVRKNFDSRETREGSRKLFFANCCLIVILWYSLLLLRLLFQVNV